MADLISVCIPAHNVEEYISETINSLLVQEGVDFEVIIVDDGSTDATFAQLNKVDDPRFRWYRQKRSGAAAARNHAWSQAVGNYIVFLDADDLLSPGFLSAQLQRASAEEDSVTVSAWGRFHGSDREGFQRDPLIIAKDMSFREWVVNYWTRCGHMTPPGRVMFGRSVMERAGPWNEDLSLNDDFEFFTRIFLNSAKIRYNPDAIFYYRSGIGGLSTMKSDRALRSYFDSVEIATRLVLQRFPDDDEVAHACANIWQMFVYETYPRQRPLCEKAKEKIAALGGSDIDFPAGGISRIMSRIVGWKLTKQVKRLKP